MRALFDTNVWNAVANSRSLSGQSLVGHLKPFSVVGAVEIFVELLAIPNPATRDIQLELFFDLVDLRVLRPFPERTICEAEFGGILAESQRYMSADQIETLRSASSSAEIVTGVKEINAGAGQDFAGLTRGMSENIKSQDPPAKRIRREASDEMGVLSVAAAMAVNQGLLREGEVQSPEELKRRLPSLWAAVSYQQAHLAGATGIYGAGRRASPSDRNDHFIVACAPYVDVLVTEDQAMRRSAELATISTQILSIADFVEQLDGRAIVED